LNNNSSTKLNTSSKTYLDCAHLSNQVCDALVPRDEKIMSLNRSTPRSSSLPTRPCASRYFLCDTEKFPDSVPVKEPSRTSTPEVEPNVQPDSRSSNVGKWPASSLQTVPRPTAGLNTRAPLSSSTDIALLGEPSFIFSPTEARQYLPCIGDLLPAKQSAPENTSGEFLFPYK
jgi:hypothetical protein